MPILHKNITAETDIHNPKWFSNANNGDYAWKNEQGNLESIDELLLPAALNFVDGSVAPPTSNAGDIYVLSSGGSVDAGWGSVSLQDWVRYDGAAWNAITPQKSSLCYNENSDTLLSFDGTAWAAIGGGDSIYTADGTLTGDRTVDLDLNTISFSNTYDFIVNFPATSPGQFIVDGSSQSASDSKLFEVKSVGTGNSFNIDQKGEIDSTGITGTNILNIRNSSNTLGLNIKSGVSLFHVTQMLTRGADAYSNGIRQVFTSTTEEMKWQQANASDFNHQIKSGTAAGSNEVRFFNKGWSNSDGFVIGASSKVGTEDISLQGETFIKGDDTLSTSTALAIYDGDGTPNKLWDFRNNGDVNINQNSTINLNDSLTFTSSNGDFILNENNGRVSMDGDKAGVEMGDASIPARLGYFRSGALGSDSRALVLQGEPTVGAPVIVYSRDDVLFEVGTFNYDGTNRRMSIKSNNISIYNNDLFIVDPLSTSAPTQIAANVINLKGKTAIKGAGTSGASMLNLYDGNESVMWQWLDDGSLKVDGSTGFTGTGSYTNFTIKNGIITAAS